jgi:hypothetical protein
LRWAVLILLAASGCLPAPGPTEAVDIATAVPSSTPSPERATAVPATDTPVVPATLTPTAPPPEVTFIKNAFCRVGPGTYYNIQTAFDLGAVSPIQGRNEDASWWLITDPQSPQTCWVSAATVETSASPDGLPLVSAPVLPDPVEGFYLDETKCNVNNGTYLVALWWLDGEGEQGYHLIRNGDELRPLREDSDHFIDSAAPLGEEILYELEAFNEYGASERTYVEAPACE